MESSKSNGEPITTIVRWRPLSPREIHNDSQKWVYIDTNKNFVYYAPIDSSGSNLKTQVFGFDKVVGPAESTQSLYNEIVESVVTAALQGVNGTIFTGYFIKNVTPFHKKMLLRFTKISLYFKKNVTPFHKKWHSI